MAKVKQDLIDQGKAAMLEVNAHLRDAEATPPIANARTVTVEELRAIHPEKELKPLTVEVVTSVPAPSNETEKPEASQPPAVIAPPQQRAPVQMDERGRQGAFDLEQAFRVASALFKGKGFPSWVKTAEQAMAVSLYLKNLGLEVMTGIQHVCEVNGRLTLWGEGPLAAVRASGNLKSIKEGFYDKDYMEICFKNKNLLTAELAFAFCRSVRKDNGEVKETWFSTLDEKTANKGLDVVWRGYRRTMYKRKARGENLKDNFGDVLQGAGIMEYDHEMAPDMPTGPAPIGLAGQMNARLEDKSEAAVQA